MTPTTPPQVWGLPRWVGPLTTSVGTGLFVLGAIRKGRSDPGLLTWGLAGVVLFLAASLVVLLVRLARTRTWALPLSNGLMACGLGGNLALGTAEHVNAGVWSLAFGLALACFAASILATMAEARVRAAAGGAA